jgi:hypothetical protein
VNSTDHGIARFTCISHLVERKRECHSVSILKSKDKRNCFLMSNEVTYFMKEHLGRYKRLFVIVGICMMCLSVCAIAYFLPLYIALDITPPSSNLPAGGWDTIEHTARTWPGDGGRYYVWRVTERVYIDEYPSSETVYDYFRSWLNKNGWVVHPSSSLYFSPCSNSLAEAEFLEPGMERFSAFIKDSEEPFRLQPVVCLAI